MKKTYCFLLVAMVACGIGCNNATTTTETKTTTTESTTIPAPAPASNDPEGLALIKKSDCGTCHNATTKIVGPSYSDIAAKYPNNPANADKLAGEVIAGSTGIWGNVPMTPHPALSKPDVEKMVAYILSGK